MQFVLLSQRMAVSKAALPLLIIVVIGCGGTKPSQSPGTPVTVSLAVSPVVVLQDGSPTGVVINIGSTSETAQVTINGLPQGVQERYAASDTNPSGLLTFNASSSSPAGTYSPTLTVASAGQTISMQFKLVVAVLATVSNTVDTTLGVNGRLEQFMTTSFQIAEWNGDFFGTGTTAAAREAMLTNLLPQHIRLQGLSQAIPMKAHTGAASDWDFTLLDQTVQPVLASADHSPEFQIAAAPAWMCDSSGHLDVTNHLNDFAVYAANLVRYYNKGGFDVMGTHFQSPGNRTITWWGVFNEYNINGLTADDYVKLYNTVVPAMLAVDPTIKLSALEFSDFGFGTGGSGDPERSLSTFLAPASAGGVATPVDVLSTHLYGTCNQADSDATVFAAIPAFVENLNFFNRQLQTRSDLANVQLWVTENNVNADFSNNGMSNCNPTQTFVTDPRGSSAFFAAWRPYVFSQLGKAGNRALYHWSYSGDQQYGEVDSKGNAYLSYWVDRTLAIFYPSNAAFPGEDILLTTATDTSSIETLATRDAGGIVRVMIVDRAVHSLTDDNGSGDPRTVVIDTSSFGTFSAASLLTIDSTTNLAMGPAGAGIFPSSRITVPLNGYGVAFLSLTP